MSRIYEAPQLELYGNVTALTSSVKCSQGSDAGFSNAHSGTPFHSDDPFPDDPDGCSDTAGG